MSVLFTYIPGTGIHYSNTSILWGTSRHIVREILSGDFESEDLEFANIFSRRDIYRRLNGHPVLLIFHYDNHNQFAELEIHHGMELMIANLKISTGMQIQDVVATLNCLSPAQSIVEQDEILFADLKLYLRSGASMGADEKDRQLSYIYCGQDISHLLS